MSSLEAVWEYREEELYPRLFGEHRREIFPLSAELFTELFAQDSVDPRWLHLGVLEFAPTTQRTSWLYVTSGGSTPWETDPAEYDPQLHSWLGVEYVFETPEQGDWPIHVLQRLLGYHVLVCNGRYGDVSVPDYGHRIPSGGAIDGSATSLLRFLALAQPEHYSSTQQLDSGKFDFLHVVGITEAERNRARATSTEDLIRELERQGAYPVTDPSRAETSM